MSYQDFTNPVDIIAQTLSDLRTKPYWDTHAYESDVTAVSGAATYGIFNFTYEGAVKGGYLRYLSTNGGVGFSVIQLKLDGTFIVNSSVAVLKYGMQNMKYAPFRLIYQKYNDDETIFEICPGFHFRTGLILNVITGAGALGSLETVLYMGKNT